MPSPARDALATHCLELLAPLGAARSKRMFGGHGFYVDDLFVALVVGDRFYLKADELAQPHFRAAGSQPFVYEGGGKPVTMGYWTAPDDAMESPEQMRPWARLAFESALRARAAKSDRPTRPARRKRVEGGAP